MEEILSIFDLMKEASNVKLVGTEKGKLKIQIHKGSNKIVSIPTHLSENLSYIVAAIICDGHIRKNKYTLIFENSDRITVNKFIRKIRDVFETHAKYRVIIDKREGRIRRYRIEITSKPIVLLLHEIYEIPRGNKCRIVKIPKLIKESQNDIKEAFIEGVFDTDGGKRGRHLGLSSASKAFRDDVAQLLLDLGFIVYRDEWVNKKYKRKYYGFRVRGDTQVAKGARYLVKNIGHA